MCSGSPALKVTFYSNTYPDRVASILFRKKIKWVVDNHLAYLSQPNGPGMLLDKLTVTGEAVNLTSTPPESHTRLKGVVYGPGMYVKLSRVPQPIKRLCQLWPVTSRCYTRWQTRGSTITEVLKPEGL